MSDYRAKIKQDATERKRSGRLRVIARVCDPGGATLAFASGGLAQVLGYHRTQNYLAQPWVQRFMGRNPAFGYYGKGPAPSDVPYVRITDPEAFLELLIGDGKIDQNDALLILGNLTLNLTEGT